VFCERGVILVCIVRSDVHFTEEAGNESWELFHFRSRPNFVLAPKTAIFLFFGRKRLAHVWCNFIFRPKIGVFGRKWHRKWPK